TEMKSRLFATTPLVCCLFAFVFTAQAQPQPKPERPVPVNPGVEAPVPCPKLEIQSASGRTLRDGQPAAFGANIAGGDSQITPTIIWNISAGSIVDGQGTRSIKVDTTGAGQNREIIAEVWVGGYAAECSVQASASIKVVGPASKVDEFADVSVEQENEKLLGVANALSNTNDHVFLIAYAGRTNVRGYASTSLRRMTSQLKTIGLPPDRISATDGGFREQPAYEIWIVPVGAEPPRPTPTIDRKEIVYPKTTPTRTPAKKPTS
ncbi:MAG: hypothetical protein ACJ72Z_14245, partial [Pyrinomonadaceae bacterium]